MSESLSLRTALNPRGIEHPVLKGVAVGATTAYVAGNIISGWLHRPKHGGVEYAKPVKKVFRFLNWVFTGMPQKDWVDHLAHHEFPDRYDRAAHLTWNENRPMGAPAAPAEAFRDPYSIVLEGYRKVLFNTPGLHHRARKKIVPFLQKLHEFDEANGTSPESRDHWPKPYRRVDMEEADPKAFRNRYPWLGPVALGGAEAVVGGPAFAAAAMGTHLAAEFAMGGFVNAVNHTGQEKGFINRVKVLLGSKQPIPDETGQFSADILTGNEGFLAGEPNHNYHHLNPQDPFLAGDTLRRDPPGFIIKQLVRVGLAEVPGAIQRD